VDARPFGQLDARRPSMSAGRQRASAAMTRSGVSRARPGGALQSRPARRSEPRLDNVSPSASSARQCQLGGHVHRETGRLFAVSQGGVEHDDACDVLAHSASVVTAARTRSQSDNYYVTITLIYGPDRTPHLPDRGRGAQLFARRRQGASDPAGGQRGGETLEEDLASSCSTGHPRAEP
jgi:hypothetical protein